MFAHAKHFTTAWFFLTVRAVLVIGLLLHIDVKMERNHQEAVHGRETILAMERHNEQMLVQHMKRTVERWEALKDSNPQISVKQVPEPIP